jgi:hypothetical protein
LDKSTLQDAASKKAVEPTARREVVWHYRTVFALSNRRAREAMALSEHLTATDCGVIRHWSFGCG